MHEASRAKAEALDRQQWEAQVRAHIHTRTVPSPHRRSAHWNATLSDRFCCALLCALCRAGGCGGRGVGKNARLKRRRERRSEADLAPLAGVLETAGYWGGRLHAHRTPEPFAAGLGSRWPRRRVPCNPVIRRH